MASQIYSRYIPPKKIKRPEIAPVIPEIHVVAEPAPPPPVIKPSASSTYSRYIPAPKTKPRNDVNEESPKRKRELEPELEKPKKAKKVKQVKEKEARTVEVVPPPVAQLKDDGASEEPKRPKKKSKKLETQETGVVEESTAEDDSKHKKVFERREKSLRKAEKLAKKEAKNNAAKQPEGNTEIVALEEPVELHDLVPLPQPEPVAELPILPLSSSLPAWLADPIRVAPTSTESFSNLGIPKDAIKVLNSKGFKDAFAVQAAVLPLLLPGKSQTPGDVLVSAATGSGKTLAYVLPMVENVSQTCVTRLRGLIVMPTRELVTQAREVCEICANAFSTTDRRRVKIGTALGNESFKAEQASLMEQEDCYDPEARKQQERRLNAKWESSSAESGEDDDFLFTDEIVSRLPDHVINYISKVDILICTPGRLVEHLKSTPGFTLEYIKWLVVDEADKLLDQTYQNWLDVVNNRISQKPAYGSTAAQQRVRKCILSATMTKDVGQLADLKLHRPKLVVLEGEQPADETNLHSEGHVLPSKLVESAVKIDDESLKPLYLIDVLTRENMISNSPADESDTSESEDDSSKSNTSSDDNSDESDKESEKVLPNIDQPITVKKLIQSDSPHGVLIFTKSNETAIRLGRLIALLESKYANIIGILTSTTRSSTRKATISSFNAGKISILVASDLVSRGLDLQNLAHVINYDVPTSITNYVHRVGRTARAGKKGSAWTLFTSTEARWFWTEIGRSEAIQRADGEKINRVTIKATIFDVETRRKYEAALEELGREASSARPRRDE